MDNGFGSGGSASSWGRPLLSKAEILQDLADELCQALSEEEAYHDEVVDIVRDIQTELKAMSTA